MRRYVRTARILSGFVTAALLISGACTPPGGNNNNPPGNDPPTLGTVAVTPTALLGQAVTASAQLNDTDGQVKLTIEWGDGEADVTALGASRTATIDHTYAAAGTFTVNFTATDDDNDSSASKTATTTISTPPPARFLIPTHSNTLALTSDGQRLIVANRDANTVSVLQVRNANGDDLGTKLAEIGVGEEPRFVALSPDDAKAYVTNSVTGTVSVIALTGTSAFEVVTTIPVGTEPRGCAVTPNGTRLIVANHTSASASIIDTSTNQVVDTVTLSGNPSAVAISNDGDTDDTDERVFVTRFFAEVITPGPGEVFDNGKQGVVDTFLLSGPAGSRTAITLSPLANVGFTADRKDFCKLLNATAVNDTFCPDTTANDPANIPATVSADPQGAFPNQLGAALIRGTRLFLPNIGAAPEPPIKFNVNLQALVHVIDTASLTEKVTEHVNINAQIKVETQPPANTANTVLTRLFGGDLIGIDADSAGQNFVLLSRGANYVLRATLAANGVLDIAASSATPAVRLQTGNIPSGVVINGAGTRAYTNNEVGYSVTSLNLQTNAVITRDIPSSEPPAPGTFAHGVLVGKLCFFTALGLGDPSRADTDNGVLSIPVRDFVPLTFRGKASDNSWSSCASCHPDGLSDRVTWSFATGPRQTIALDAFFAKDNPHDQRISNWSAVRGSTVDFNENSINVQGGVGFAGTPANPNIYNHGITQGASDTLDAQELWVQTVRAPILPDVTAALLANGRTLFGTNCASCHGGAKWTKSQVFYLDNPVFNAVPVAGSVARDPGVVNTAAQIRSYTVAGITLTYMETVGTFNAAGPLEIRSNVGAAAGGALALGGVGFNVPSLLGIAYEPPYFHDGSAPTLQDVFTKHVLAGGTIATQLSATQQSDLLVFLNSIDGATAPFRSAGDDFRDAISP